MRDIGSKLHTKINNTSHKHPGYSHEAWEMLISKVEEELNMEPTEKYLVSLDQIWQFKKNRIINDTVIAYKDQPYTELLEKAVKEIENYQIPSTTLKKLEAIANQLDEEEWIVEENGRVWLGVDGACRNNGNEDARASIGIYA